MKISRIAAILLLAMLLVTGFACGRVPAAEPTPTLTPTPIPTATPNPPLNVHLDYIGVECAHGGHVQLVVEVKDGDRAEKYLIPPVEAGEVVYMGDFAIKELNNQRVFHTPFIKGNLEISILAYHRDQAKSDYLDWIAMMEWYYRESILPLKNLVSNMPENDELIGYYEQTWYPDENWGIGQHGNVGAEGLRVWYSIWSDTEPSLPSKPTLLPDVRIQSLSIPSQVNQRCWFCDVRHTLTLVNNEDCDITVDWQAHSSVTGDFASDSVTVPSHSHIDVKRSYCYCTLGSAEVTYTISYKGSELDSQSVTVTVIP